MPNISYDEMVQNRIAHEKLATRSIKAINDLWYDKGIEMVLFRNQLIDKRASEILSLHNYAHKMVGKPIDVEATTALLEAMLTLDLCPARMDIGRLASEWHETGGQPGSEIAFLEKQLAGFIGPENYTPTQPKDVVLYGFGRIGCFLTGCCYGSETDLSWGMAFPQGSPPTEGLVHPTQLYELAAGVAIWLVGRRLLGRLRAGEAGLWVLSLLSLERFLIEFVRAKDDRILGSFTVAQAVAVGVLALCLFLIARLRRRPRPAP